MQHLKKNHPLLFSEKKAAQVAAFFLFQAKGELAVLKLMKLMYLAERLSFEVFGSPMIGDKLVSMKHGPVLSQTLDYINGYVVSVEGGWETWIADKADHMVALRDPSCIRSDDDLLELSEADIEVLRKTWLTFGHMDKYAIRDYTHDHCPEWQDPDGSSKEIPYEQLLEKLGFSSDKIDAIIANINEQAEINAAFSRNNH